MKIFDIRACGKGHYQPPEGYMCPNYANVLSQRSLNYCIEDGTVIQWIQIEENSEQFNDLFERVVETHGLVFVDNYKLQCDQNHVTMAFGYGQDKNYKYCPICGHLIIKCEPNISEAQK